MNFKENMKVNPATGKPFETFELLNIIRNESSENYQRRVALATPTNIAEVGHGIFDYSATYNEFLPGFVERIWQTVLRESTLKNTLSKFKLDNMPVGELVQESHTDIQDEEMFNPEATPQEVFKRVKPKNKVAYHRINRRGLYRTTVSQVELKSAFNSYGTLDRFVNDQIGTLHNSNEVGEFIYMKDIISNYAQTGLVKLVNIDQFGSVDGSTNLVKGLKTMSGYFKYNNNLYNEAKHFMRTPIENQFVINTVETNTDIDVDVQANAFNLDRVQYMGQREEVDYFETITIPEGQPNAGTYEILSVLMDKSFYMVKDQLTQLAPDTTGYGLYTTYSFHKHQMLSCSPFAQIVVFVRKIDGQVKGLAGVDTMLFDGDKDKRSFNLGEDDTEMTREEVKTELDKLEVEYQPTAQTKTLVKLLEETKAATLEENKEQTNIEEKED